MPIDRLIHPAGPIPCDGLMIGEAGGQTEHYTQRPFAGKTGNVLTTYMKAAGVPRPDVCISNVYAGWTGPGNPEPTPEQIAAEEWRLEELIERCQPRVIAALGRVAIQWFLGPDADTSLHGVPHASDRAPGAIILPCLHPAAGFYNPALAAYCQDDIMRFAYLLKNPTANREPPKIEVIEHTEDDIFLDGPALDTEGLEDKPWGYSWSYDGKTTHVKVSQRGPKKLIGRVTFQNALHDLKILRAMGVDVSNLDYDDTMVMLYVLQLEPQGLKSAAFRHLGLKMREFDEVVRPHFDAVAMRWLQEAAAKKYKKPRPVAIADYQKRKWRLYKPWDAGRRIKGILKSRETGKGEQKLEKRWADLDEQFQDEAEYAVGRSFPDYSIFHVPRAEAVQYSGIDAAATKLLKDALDPLIDAKGLREVYETDRRAIRFVDRMQETGMRINLEKLKALEVDLEKIRDQERLKVQRVVGDRWFNPGSDDQVAKWLYSVKGLPVMKYTEGGQGSTNDAALKLLRGYHGKDDPEVAAFTMGVKAYREAEKYRGTFVVPIFKFMKRDWNGDWRIHPNFRITRVVSGRLSSHEPNVLAFPVRTELGKKIRDCFEAAEGFAILSVDESQVELRMMAHHCMDKRMRQAFENNEDLHTLTASVVFKVPLDKVTKIQRYVAKIINFATMYGISAKALLEQLYKAEIFDYTYEDCVRFIAEWFKMYGAVSIFLNRVWKQASKDGFVRDMWGRICYVPNLNVGDQQMREAAQRLAGNMPIQGGAHGLVKRAEIAVDDWTRADGLMDDVRPWLQMHDELIMEVRRGRDDAFVSMVCEKVKAIMVQDQELIRVPIAAEGSWGQSWAGAK